MNLINYLGKFHPLVVHLPIGMLTFFLFLGIFISRDKMQRAYPTIRLMLLVSALSATISSISGYLLASSGSYEGRIVTVHQILGISLTIINWIIFLYLKYLLDFKPIIYRGILVIMFVIMILAGHAGGSLTHGADFLSPPPLGAWFSSESGIKKKISLNSTAYETTAFIFTEKCVVCHGANKQKGKLRLDSKEHILLGGESGTLLTDHAKSSLLIERITLPLEDEDHMPPKERKQLSDIEIDYLVWWIETGAEMGLSLKELTLPDSLSSILTHGNGTENPNIAGVEVKQADESVVNQLKSLGVIVTPVGQNSNYLSASFVNVLSENSTVAVDELEGIKDQLIILNLDYQQLPENSWNIIGDLTNLRKLSVKDSNLDDEKIKQLQSLAQLTSLNLVGTKVSLSGLKGLEHISNLKKVFLYQTEIQGADFIAIQQLFPDTDIDTGNYLVPILESDTTVLRLEDLSR